MNVINMKMARPTIAAKTALFLVERLRSCELRSAAICSDRLKMMARATGGVRSMIVRNVILMRSPQPTEEDMLWLPIEMIKNDREQANRKKVMLAKILARRWPRARVMAVVALAATEIQMAIRKVE